MPKTRDPEFVCAGCGAKLHYSSRDRSLTCAYCGTVNPIDNQAVDLPSRPTLIAPSLVNITNLVDAVYEHLAKGELTPDHLLEHAVITKKEIIYVPVYRFEGNFEAKWSASFGYDREEPYTAYEVKNDQRVPVTRYRTVTDWRPVNGVDSGGFSVIGYGGATLNEEALDVCALIEQIEYDFVTYDPAYVASCETEAFAKNDDEVYETRAKSKVNEIIDDSVKDHSQGDRQKDWHWTASTKRKTFTALVPICRATYEFDGKQYHLWVSGVELSAQVGDLLPVDNKRKRAIFAGFVPFAISVIAGVVGTLAFNVDWQWSVITALPFAYFGYKRKSSILKHSKDIRKTILANKRVSATNTGDMNEAQLADAMRDITRPRKPLFARVAGDIWLIPLLTVAAGTTPYALLLQHSTPDSTATTAASVLVAKGNTAKPAGTPNSTPQTSSYSGAHRSFGAAAGSTSNSSSTIASAVTPNSVGTTVAAQNSISAGDSLAGMHNVTSTINAASQKSPQSAAAGTNLGNSVAAANVGKIASNSSPVSDHSGPASSDVTSGSPINNKALVVALITKAMEGDWNAVSQEINSQRKKNTSSIPARVSTDAAVESRSRNNDGLSAFRSNDLDGALKDFAQAYKVNPNNLEALNNYGYMLIKAGQPSAAKDALISLISRDPMRTTAWVNLARVISNDNENAAIGALKIAIYTSTNRHSFMSALVHAGNKTENVKYRDAIFAAINAAPPLPSAVTSIKTPPSLPGTQ